MATSNFLAVPTNSSDALFRAWSSGLSTALAACGLVNHTPNIANVLGIGASGGELTWANIVAPSSIRETKGFEIWCFDDDLQATLPIYIKIKYGSSSSNVLVPRLSIQVGISCDASGELANATTEIDIGGTSTTTALNCYISSDGGRVNVAMFTTTSNGYTIIFYVERLKDNDGNPTAEGVNLLCAGTYESTTSFTQKYLPSSGSQRTTSSPMCAAPSSGTGSYGDNIGLYPIYPNLGYAANPDMGALVYFLTDIASAGSPITVNIYGEDHIFITSGGINATAEVNGNAADYGLAVRYE